jgi:hypothetical protein
MKYLFLFIINLSLLENAKIVKCELNSNSGFIECQLSNNCKITGHENNRYIVCEKELAK